MREYNPNLFRNHNQSLKEIESLIKVVDKRLFNVDMHYINKITGQIKNDTFYKIRDSITLRIDSIIFHYKILNSVHNPSKKIITNDFFSLSMDIIPIQQKYLFDSIIFNCISLYDYLASMINLIIEKSKDNWKKTWSSLENYARGNDQFIKTKLGLKIIEVNKDWVNNLNEYRSELIHYQTENLGSRKTYHPVQRQLDVLVLAPIQLKKYFKQLKQIAEKQDYNINSVSLWIIKTCI
jgi:hypothetical protein